MRSLVAPALGLTCFALGLTAFADPPTTPALDPLPVHTATTRIVANSLPPADRLRLADAVAQVLIELHVPEVRTATATRNNLQELGGPGNSCDTANCANQVFGPLHGRAVVMVHQARTRGRATLDIELINLRGESVAHEHSEEAINSWDDAVEFARLATRHLVEHVRADERNRSLLSAPTPAVVTPPPNNGNNGNNNNGNNNGGNNNNGSGAQQVVVTPPMVLVPEMRSSPRWWEVGLGGALIAGGVTLATIGVANLVLHDTIESTSGNTETVRCAVGADFDGRNCTGLGVITPTLLVTGALALGAGVYFTVHGARARSETMVLRPAPTTTGPRVLNVSASPLAQGAALSLSGTF